MKKYRNTIEFEVYGPYALFSDPVMRVGGEKTSYHIPTYEALRGIVESIYWKPTIMWIVDAVQKYFRTFAPENVCILLEKNLQYNDLNKKQD